jgi:hypothetical protein
MEATMKLNDLNESQLSQAAMRMAAGSDGFEAGQNKDWDGVREALREALRDGYHIHDFVDGLAPQVITEAFEIHDGARAWTWVVRRTDGKYAVAYDSDVSVDTLADDVVVIGAEWHDTLASLRAEIRVA